MKKNSLLVIVSAVFMFCFIPKVDALLCTRGEYSRLKYLAYDAEPSYELKFDNNHNYYYELTVKNVDKEVMVKFNGIFYEPENGVVKISDRITGGSSYEVNLYGRYGTDCTEEYLYGTTLQIPKYNVYSERDECIEYEEFYMCNKWYQGDILSDAEFETKLDEYVASLNVTEEEKTEKPKKDFFQSVVDFYNENIVFTLPITILIVLLIIYKIVVTIIRRKNRIKLD